MTAGCALDEVGLGYIDQLGPEQDDHAQLVSVFRSDYHANDSFERGSTLFWGKGGGASTSVMTSSSSDGSNHLRLYGYGGYVWQTIRVADVPNTNRARMNHKKYSPASSGTVYLALYAGHVVYDDGGCGDPAQYKPNWDFVNPSSEVPTFVRGVTASPTNVWQYQNATTTTHDIGWEGVDYRVYAYNYMTLDGEDTYVRLDRIRAYDD